MHKANSVAIYSVDKLMSETRRLAVEFRKTTGQALAVTGELANYDAYQLLSLSQPVQAETSVDALGPSAWNHERLQIKGRVLFDNQKSKQRLGQLNLEANWQRVLLVLYNDEYLPDSIYVLSKQKILQDEALAKNNKRGSMTVAKFKAIGQRVWDAKQGLCLEPPTHASE